MFTECLPYSTLKNCEAHYIELGVKWNLSGELNLSVRRGKHLTMEKRAKSIANTTSIKGTNSCRRISVENITMTNVYHFRSVSWASELSLSHSLPSYSLAVVGAS